MGEEVKLIGSIGSLNCTRIEWALKLKGIDYEYIEEDLRNKSPLLLNLNPVHKKVPVLVHADKPLPESLVILEYIDETWKHAPLLPQDPHDRANARFWAKVVDDKCLYDVYEACKAEGDGKKKAIEKALEQLAFLEKLLQGKKFFGGEQIGYLDLVAGWLALWLGVMEEIGGMKLLDAQRFPCLHKWRQNFTEIPIIKECLPPRQLVLEYMQGGLNYLRSLSANKP